MVSRQPPAGSGQLADRAAQPHVGRGGQGLQQHPVAAAQRPEHRPGRDPAPAERGVGARRSARGHRRPGRRPGRAPWPAGRARPPGPRRPRRAAGRPTGRPARRRSGPAAAPPARRRHPASSAAVGSGSVATAAAPAGGEQPVQPGSGGRHAEQGAAGQRHGAAGGAHRRGGRGRLHPGVGQPELVEQLRDLRPAGQVGLGPDVEGHARPARRCAARRRPGPAAPAR